MIKYYFLSLIIFLIFCNASAYPQSRSHPARSSEEKKQAYQLWTAATSFKNKDKNCSKAIETYLQSLALYDFEKPFFYQSIAACYAQTGDNEKAFIYLNKMLAAGWIDTEAIKKDTDLTKLLAEQKGGKFLVQAEKQKRTFVKNLLPETYGVAENPAWRKVEAWSRDSAISAAEFFRRASNFNDFPQPKKTGVFVKFTNHFSDKVPAAPFYVYIPSGYDAKKPHAVLIYSPGGWYGRKDFMPDEAREFVFENPVLPLAEKENFIEIFPAGDNAVGTYQYEGIENIRQILAKTKRIFNVDDNRVYLMGFSDGGTGAFRTAVFMPTEYAAFYAVNGRPFANNRFVNMSNRPFYSLSATNDTLFEIATTRSYFDFAKTVDANWLYREVAGEDHYYLPFLEDYLPAILSHIKSNSRNAFGSRLNWETSWAPIGKIDWIEIAEIGLKRPRAQWHKIYEYQKKNSEGTEIVKIGDESAAIRASYFNNTFEIETSCVAKLNINLHQAMIDFTQPVKVIVNDKKVFDQTISPNKDFMAKVFDDNADRDLIWENQLSIEVSK